MKLKKKIILNTVLANVFFTCNLYSCVSKNHNLLNITKAFVSKNLKIISNYGTRRSYYHTNTILNILDKSNLLAVLNNNNPAIKLKNYVPDTVLESAINNLSYKHGDIEYQNAKGVIKVDIGMAYFEIENNIELELKYYSDSVKNLQYIRDTIFSPYLSPLDKLRLEIDELWPGGSTILDLGKGKMFSGLIRKLNEHVLAHEDKLERDYPLDDNVEASKISNYKGQLAANIYMSTPTTGGDIMLWNKSLSDKEYDNLRNGSYGIEISKLPRPDFVIKPEQGDLILFNPRNLHSIKKNISNEKPRITISTFLHYSGEDNPLKFWS